MAKITILLFLKNFYGENKKKENLKTNKKKRIFKVYLFVYGKNKKIQKNSKNKKIWKQIRKSGLSIKILCSALDFHWKSIFSIFIYLFIEKIQNSKQIQKIFKKYENLETNKK